MVAEYAGNKMAAAERFLRDTLGEGDRPVDWLAEEVVRKGICGVRTLYRAAARVVRHRYPDLDGYGRQRKQFWSLQRPLYGERVTGKPASRGSAGRKGVDVELKEDPEWSFPYGSPLRSLVSARAVVGRLRGELLHRRALTSEQLAQALDVDTGTAQRMVSLKPPRLPNIELLALLHYCLGVDLNHILVGTPPDQKRLPSGAELEDAVRAYVAKTIARKHDLSLEYVLEVLKGGGELLPKLFKECEAAVFGTPDPETDLDRDLKPQ